MKYHRKSKQAPYKHQKKINLGKYEEMNYSYQYSINSVLVRIGNFEEK